LRHPAGQPFQLVEREESAPEGRFFRTADFDALAFFYYSYEFGGLNHGIEGSGI